MMTFEETLQQLLAWMGEPVEVVISPRYNDHIQAASLFGILSPSFELPRDAATEVGPAATGELFFFPIKRAGKGAGEFLLAASLFEGAILRRNPGTAEGVLDIYTRGIEFSVLRRPERRIRHEDEID
jgi:hypothetical protein